MKTFVQVSEKSQTNAVFHLATSGQLDCGDQKGCKSQGFFFFFSRGKKKKENNLLNPAQSSQKNNTDTSTR